MAAAPPPPSPLAPAPSGPAAAGWAIALAVLVSVRAGRRRAQSDRLDVAALQGRQQESRVQGRELRERRRQYLEEQRLRKEAEAARRLEEAKKRAAHEAAERAEQRAREAAESARQLERMRREREAARQAFEEGQSRLDEELSRRIALEEELLRERERQRAEAEAAARAAAEEARKADNEAAKRREEEGRQRREEEERRRQERRQRLRSLETTYGVEVSGVASAAPAPPGSTTAGSAATGTPPLPARLEVSVALDAAAPPGATEGDAARGGGLRDGRAARLYESAEAALDGAGALAAEAARQIASRLEADPSAALRRPPSGPGMPPPPAPLRFPELRLLSWLLALTAEEAGRVAIGQVAPLVGGDSGSLSQPFSAFAVIGVLPEDDPSALGRALELAAAKARAGRPAAAAALLDDVASRVEDGLLTAPFRAARGGSLGGAGAGGPAAPDGAAAAAPRLPLQVRVLVEACVCALLLDLHEDPFRDAAPPPQQDGDGKATADAEAGDDGGGSGGGGELRRLVRNQLRELCKHAPRDALTAPAAAVARLFGARHPVARDLVALAEAGMSGAARQARELRRQQQAVAASMGTLQQQGSLLAGPGGLDPGSSKARGAPVPEKAWAARNVARSLIAGGGEAGIEEGARMLREAAAECEEHYGPTHPAQLSVLLDLIDALLLQLGSRPEAKAEAAAAIHRAMAIAQARHVAERYRSQGDLPSAALLLESAQAELDFPQVLPRDDPEMGGAVRKAAEAFGQLETSQAARVEARRRVPAGSPSSALRVLARDCAEQPLVQRAARRSLSRLDEWNKGLPLSPLL